MPNRVLLLLHGALGSSIQFAPLLPHLDGRYDVHPIDFEGHGAAPLAGRPFRIEHFAENVGGYLEQHHLESVDIFGYSMGGYVACTLALSHPHLVGRIATLGTKFHWDNETAKRETAFLDPEKIKAKVPHFARTLEDRHTAAGWETVVNRTADLLWSLAPIGGIRAKDVARFRQLVRIMVGDRDSTVSVEECAEMYRAIPNGQLEVLPGTRHELEKVSTERLVYSLTQFFA